MISKRSDFADQSARSACHPAGTVPYIEIARYEGRTFLVAYSPPPNHSGGCACQVSAAAWAYLLFGAGIDIAGTDNGTYLQNGLQ